MTHFVVKPITSLTNFTIEIKIPDILHTAGIFCSLDKTMVESMVSK